MNHLGCVASVKRIMPVIALFGAAACDNAQRGHDVIADAGKASAEQSSNASATVGPKWLPHQTYTYRLKLASGLAIGKQPPMVEFDLASEAKLEARELPDKSLQFSIRLVEPKFIKGSGEADGGFAESWLGERLRANPGRLRQR